MPLGRADDAIRFYELALDLDLTDVSTRLNLANQLIFMGRFDQARDHVAKARADGLGPYGSGRPIA